MAFEIPRGVSTSLQFLVLFRMPLFFFVSGFLAYKASQVWNLATFGQLVGKKLRETLIICISSAFPLFSCKRGE